MKPISSNKKFKDEFMGLISLILYYVLAVIVYDKPFMLKLIQPFYILINVMYYLGVGESIFWLSNYFRNKIFHANAKERKLILSSVIIFLYTLTIVVLFDYTIVYLGTEDRACFWESAYIRTISSSLIAIIYIIRNYGQVVLENAEQNSQLKDDLQKESEKATRAQLNMLKIQLDPHFMFNSLNTLVGLIDENPKDAQKFTLELSNIYKYIVSNINTDAISLATAIDFIHDYCQLIKIRYPQQFDIRIEEDIVKNQNEKVLPLSLQLLVENAIKHNQHSKEHPLIIRILREDDYICVINTLRPYNEIERKTHINSTGIGMRNLYERYKLLTDKIPLVLESKTEYIVKVPII